MIAHVVIVRVRSSRRIHGRLHGQHAAAPHRFIMMTNDAHAQP